MDAAVILLQQAVCCQAIDRCWAAACDVGKQSAVTVNAQKPSLPASESWKVFTEFSLSHNAGLVRQQCGS